jgi:hypothetical protein
MSTSRIEIPLTLQPPHFDDDATIATARQVVPIKGGRRIEGRRKVLALLPLLASTLCGALGAIAVNYFERRREAVTSVMRQQPNVSTQAKTEPSPVAIAPELNAKNTEIEPPVQPENSSVTPADEPTQKSEAPKIAKREDADRKLAPNAAMKREPAQDAAKLVRQRRVQPANSEIPLRRNRRTDAGRIEDLFTGPNP